MTMLRETAKTEEEIEKRGQSRHEVDGNTDRDNEGYISMAT